jgi:hypothetical protein
MRSIFFVLVSTTCCAQHLSVGVKGGVPLTDFFKTAGSFSSVPKRYTVGPMIDIQLPFGLGIEFDALYKRFGYESTTTATRGNSWQFPLVLKLRAPGLIVRPYGEAGFAFQKLTGVKNFIGGLVSTGPGELKKTDDRGLVIGAGLDVKLPVIRIAPELRFTRWFGDTFQGTGIQNNRNQAEFLVGLTF